MKSQTGQSHNAAHLEGEDPCQDAAVCVYVRVHHQLWRVVVGHGERRPAGGGGEPGARARGRGGGRTQLQPCRLLGTRACVAGGSLSSRQAPRLHFDVKSSNLRCGDYLELFSSGKEPGPELAAVSLAAPLSRGLFSPPRSSLALSPRPCSRSQDFLPAALAISLPSSSLVVGKTDLATMSGISAYQAGTSGDQASMQQAG